MTRVIRVGLIQASIGDNVPTEMNALKAQMIEKHLALIDDAAKRDVEILCLQELFYGPYFCAEQDRRWYAMAEKIPEGPTVRLMQDVAKKYGMALVGVHFCACSLRYDISWAQGRLNMLLRLKCSLAMGFSWG